MFVLGDRVWHHVFDHGTVTGIYGIFVTVQFDKVGVKSLHRGALSRIDA